MSNLHTKWLTAAVTGGLLTAAGLVIAQTNTEQVTTVITTTEVKSDNFGSSTGPESGRLPGTTNNSRDPEETLRTTSVASVSTVSSEPVVAAVEQPLPTEPTSAGVTSYTEAPATTVAIAETSSPEPEPAFVERAPRADRN